MTDNIKPNHYRKGEIDLYEAFSQIFPHNEYRAGMQMIAMRYMFRDKIDRVEDIDKAMETMKRWKEKEIEHREKQEKVKSNKTLKELFADMGKDFDGIDFDEWFHNKEDSERIYLLKGLLERGFEYLARDKVLLLWAYKSRPKKSDKQWVGGVSCKIVEDDNFPEVKWTDNEPTEIANLLATYENGGENGK